MICTMAGGLRRSGQAQVQDNKEKAKGALAV